VDSFLPGLSEGTKSQDYNHRWMCVINGLKISLYLYLARRCKIFFDNLSRSAGLEILMYFYETESLDKMATKLCIKFSPLLVIL
jgi:hypothetical protein